MARQFALGATPDRLRIVREQFVLGATLGELNDQAKERMTRGNAQVK